MCHDSFAVHQLTDSTFICLEHLQLQIVDQEKELDVSCEQKEDDEKVDKEDQVMDDEKDQLIVEDQPVDEQED